MVVEKIVAQPFNVVKERIFNLKYYEQWWNSYKAVVNIERGSFYFYPIPFIKIELLVTKVSEKKIEFSYIGGPFRGIGTWKITPIDVNNTKISYTIDINSVWLFFNFFLKTSFFKKKHSNDIMKLLNRLEISK